MHVACADSTQCLALCSDGALYLGGFQYLLFSKLYPRLLPHASRFAASAARTKLRDGRGFASVLAQVGLSQGLHWPFVAIPCFYLFKGWGAGETPGATLSTLQQNWASDVAVCWAFWLPTEFLSFGFLPIHWQLPFVAVVSFAYTSFVSYRRGERLEQPKQLLGSHDRQRETCHE